VVANIGRDELRAKMDRGDPFILLGQRGRRLSYRPAARRRP
jgi:hypothetical protein